MNGYIWRELSAEVSDYLVEMRKYVAEYFLFY